MVSKCALFSFRMIGDTRIECQDANPACEDTESKTVGSHGTGAEPRSPASAEVDEPLSTAGSQRELCLPALWNQSAEFLSLVETVRPAGSLHLGRAVASTAASEASDLEAKNGGSSAGPAAEVSSLGQGQVGCFTSSGRLFGFDFHGGT